MKQGKRMRNSLVIRMAAAIALLALLSMGTPGMAQAANGQCRWEGGAGASGGFAYCKSEDCMGNGGLALCTKGVGSAVSSLEPMLGPDKWSYGTCDHFNPHMANVALWCTSAGGQWEGSQGGCTNLPSGIFSGGSGMNSESRAMAIARKWADSKFGSNCSATEVSDTGWHATLSPNMLCWSGSDSHQLGILTKSLRKKSYQSTGQGCSGTLSISFMMSRGSKCPPGYKSRSGAPEGQQCYIPRDECGTFGNPTSPISGCKTQDEVDYRGAGSTALEFVRHYHSAGIYRPGNLTTSLPSSEDMQGSDFWIHSYDRRLYFVSGNSEIIALNRRQDGTVTSFDTQGREQANTSGAAALLVQVPGLGWDLTLGDSTVERYSDSGRLISIVTRTGRTTTLTYTNDQLTTVTGPFGHSIQLAYNSEGLLNTLTLPGGEVILYEYDEWKRLIEVAYPARGTRTYSYEDARNGWLLTAIAENGTNYAAYTYDDAGRVIDSQHAGGADRYRFSYSTSGATQVTDPSGAVFTVGFQNAGGLLRTNSISVSCRDCGPISAWTHDANGNPSATTEFNGAQTLYLYDLSRNLETWRTEAAGTPLARVINTQWHPTFREPTEIAEAGRITSYTYDSQGNQLTRTETDTATNTSRTWSTTYNALGQALTVDGPRTDVSDTTTFTYYSCATGNECGQVSTVTNAVGHTTYFQSYDAHGKPLTVVDANGVVTQMTYDGDQRLTSRAVGTEVTQFEYWQNGLLKKKTHPDSSFSLYTYDAARRLIGVENDEGSRIAYTLDAAGNRLREEVFDSFGAPVRVGSATYDSMGRRSSDVGANNQITTYVHDYAGRLTSMTDPMGRSRSFKYDELDRLNELVNPAGMRVLLSYSALDGIESITDPRDLQTTYLTNAFGEIEELASPDTGVSTAAFTADGKVESTADAGGRTAEYAYDALGRVVLAEHGDQSVSYLYDAGVNAIGRVSQIVGTSASLGWTYDPQGRVLTSTQTVGTLTRQTSFAYDEAGRLATQTTPSGQVISYQYSHGRLSRVAVNGTELIGDILYSPFGPTRGWRWGNGTYTAREYNSDGQVTATESAGFSALTYYSDGSLKSVEDDSLAPSSALTPSLTVEISSTSNRINQLQDGANRTYSYDGSGNVLSDGLRSFVYDALGRMVQATSAGMTTSYAYNGLGQRVLKTNAAGTQYFVYDANGHLTGVYGPSGTLIEEIVWFDDIPIATIRTTEFGGIGFFYIHTDHLDTPVRVTRASDNAIMWRWDRDPFGNGAPNEDAESNGQYVFFNLRFPGQYFDSETGLNYNYFRDYDPALGRYVESDPLGLRGGINTFAYASLRPVSSIDPKGLFSLNVREFLYVVDKLNSGGEVRPSDKVWGSCECMPCGESWRLGECSASFDLNVYLLSTVDDIDERRFYARAERQHIRDLRAAFDEMQSAGENIERRERMRRYSSKDACEDRANKLVAGRIGGILDHAIRLTQINYDESGKHTWWSPGRWLFGKYW